MSDTEVKMMSSEPLDPAKFAHHSWCTTITWQDADHQLHPELDADRAKILAEMFEAGLMRLPPVFVNESTTKRFWPSENIAHYYVNEMQKLAEKYNCTIVTSVVENNA